MPKSYWSEGKCRTYPQISNIALLLSPPCTMKRKKMPHNSQIINNKVSTSFSHSWPMVYCSSSLNHQTSRPWIMKEKINALCMHRKWPFSCEIFLCEAKNYLFLEIHYNFFWCAFCFIVEQVHKIIVDEGTGQSKKIFPFFMLPFFIV